MSVGAARPDSTGDAALALMACRSYGSVGSTGVHLDDSSLGNLDRSGFRITPDHST